MAEAVLSLNNLPEHVHEELHDLWRHPQAWRQLARLLYAVYFGGDARVIYIKRMNWRVLAPDMDRLCQTHDKDVFIKGITWSTLRNFATRTTQTPRDHRIFNTIAYYLVDHLDREPTYRKLLAVEELLDEFDILALFQHRLGTKLLSETEYRFLQLSLDDAAGTPNQFLQALYNLKPPNIGRACQDLLRSTGDGYSAETFLCYRYATTAGSIAKSFIRLESPATAGALCQFQHHYIDTENDQGRLSKGYLLPHDNAYYFLGNIESGGGLMMIVLRADLPPQQLPSISGLILTMDSVGDPLVARVVLKRTQFPNPQGAQCGVFREDKLDEHVSLDGDLTDQQTIHEKAQILRDQIRNDISSELAEPIFNSHDRRIQGKQEIIAIVAEALRLTTEEPLLTRGQSREPYNPIADRGLPFNAALKLK